MALINTNNINLTFGGPLLLSGVNLSVEHGEKISLIGRNGTGKTTLLKLLSGKLQPDSGTIVTQKNIKTAFLSQEIPHNISGSVFDVVASGLHKHYEQITKYHEITNRLSKESTPHLLEELTKTHNRIEAEDGWEVQQHVDKTISQLSLDPDIAFETLSAGKKRKVLLGKALANRPDILLLDEPTNHMDIDSIKQLEELIIKFEGTVVFVTHDRMFLRKVANRIIEIDRGTLFSQSCDYDTFLTRKQAALEAEEAEQAQFDKKLAKEEEWVRQGIKARRTRNEGRVRMLKEMREVRGSRREKAGMAKMEVQETNRSGKIVVDAKNLNFGFGNNSLISNFSTTILQGDRVGIIGPNGIGKTTLLNILIGNLTPQAGSVRMGTRLKLNYFDQMRNQLDETKSVRENICNGADFVTINGKNRHIIGYLKDFLFSPDQAVSPVSTLSGGERNRLLLAKTFLRPSNLLVLDEPTNDLDAETLELLEDILIKYSGTVFLVSHDRAFINNVVTSTIVFEGNGVVKEYIGNYDDWVRQRKDKNKTVKVSTFKKETSKSTGQKSKLGYILLRELNGLPKKIESLEADQEKLYKIMGDPSYYKKEKSEILSVKEKLDSVKSELTEAYNRWEELEELKG